MGVINRCGILDLCADAWRGAGKQRSWPVVARPRSAAEVGLPVWAVATGSCTLWLAQCCGSPGRKQLISTNTIRLPWRGAAGASSRPRAVQIATTSAFSPGIVTGWPASRASAIPSFRPHRPSGCCRQGGSPGGATRVCANPSFHVTAGKTSVAQVRSTGPPILLLYGKPKRYTTLPMAPRRWLSPSGHTV